MTTHEYPCKCSKYLIFAEGPEVAFKSPKPIEQPQPISCKTNKNEYAEN